MDDKSKIIIDLFTPCETLFVLINRDPKSVHAKKFLNLLKEDTDNLLIQSKDFTYKSFLNSKRRPYLFELIRYTKEELFSKNFSKLFIEELDFSLDELGFSYGVPFTLDDIVKLTVISANYKDDMDFKLSLDESEIKNKKTR